jgi:hypothetical protein
MGVMTAVPMVRLTTVTGSFAAHVLAARLTDEGFDVQLRGSATNSYLTMAPLVGVDVFVPEDQIAEASYVLLVNEVDVALDEEPEERRRRRARQARWPRRWVAIAIIIGAIWPAARLVRLFAVGSDAWAVPAFTTR